MTLPPTVQDEKALVDLYETLMSTARRYKAENLPRAVNRIVSTAASQAQKPAKIVAILQKLADALKRLDEIEYSLSLTPGTIAQEAAQPRRVARLKKERDQILSRISEKDKAITTAPTKETTADRHRRYKDRFNELRAEGQKTRPAASEIHREEAASGRTPPTAETIRRICMTKE